jgi:choice-of-anchor C domain-containing protein
LIETSSASGTPAKTNLIKNGSFESPTVCPTPFATYFALSKSIPGWTIGGVSVDLGCTIWAAESGTQSVDLDGSQADGSDGNASGSLSQTVHTTPGHKYLLSWFMAGNPSQGCGPVTKVLHVSWDGKLKEILTFNVSNDSYTSMGWVAKQLVVVAKAKTKTSVVTFADATASGPCGVTLDNVSLTAR